MKPFVKPGEPMGFVSALQERGLWPPRLHNRGDNRDKGKTATPFLVVPSTLTDIGLRPLPNSQAFHSQSVWIEELGGTVVTSPVVNGRYRIKCRVRNYGAFPAYGGMVDFYINRPSVFSAAAASPISLRTLGQAGFSLLQGAEKIIECPNVWKVETPDDLSLSILVHVYDPFADTLTNRFDARNDRHVGRHDLAADLYVRDWTFSGAVHDMGLEPSSQAVFYQTSDVWNRRTPAAGVFFGDRPQNENPQQGPGKSGDNYMFARISRNDASMEQRVKAHFMFAEFGTGSPFVSCSAASDPEVTLKAGELSKIVSLPWHLHPSSSTHLCIAVQIYSADDPFQPPGLVGYTPGWPTTDMMVINDNNKAQRNMSVWEGVPETGGMILGIIFNAATFARDVTLILDMSKGEKERLAGAMIYVPQSDYSQRFESGSKLILKNMLPGERRWIGFAFDRFSAEAEESLTVHFKEMVDEDVINGFAFNLRATTPADMLQNVVAYQCTIFYRLAKGMGVDKAEEGFERCQKLKQTTIDAKTYLEVLPQLATLLAECLKQMAGKFGGIKDFFGVIEHLTELTQTEPRQLVYTLALHNKLLHQVDALQTMTLKSLGDLADALFTVRLQYDLYQSKVLAESRNFEQLLRDSAEFIQAYPFKARIAEKYVALVQALMPYFETTANILENGVLKARFKELDASLKQAPPAVQKAHLNFLNAVLLVVRPR